MTALPSVSVFQHNAFARYWCARVLTALGTQIQVTAIGWQIYDAARDAGQDVQSASLLLGAVGLVQFLPLVTLSLFGGQAADRYDRPFIVCLGTVVKAALAAALVGTSMLPAHHLIPIVFAITACTGAANAFMPAAQTALLPMLVPRDVLPRAIAWGSLGFQSAVIIGPVLGGLLYGLGAQAAYLTTYVCFALSAALFFSLKPPRQPRNDTQSAIALIAEGLNFVRNNKIVLGAISLDLVVVMIAGAVALLPVFARDILHAGPLELGLLRSAMGAGAAAIALLIAIQPLRENVGRWMFGATITFGLATIVFGLSTSIWLTCAALFVAGGVDMVSVYVRQNLIQLNTPDNMRGRVGAVSYVFVSASNELGDFEAGLMARLFGPVIAVALGGGVAVGASLLWMRLFPALAKADGFEPMIEREDTTAKVASG